MTGHLRLHLLGQFQVLHHDKPVAGLTSPKIQALLAYLAVEIDQPQPRAFLAELLWPDRAPGVAQQNLRQSLARLQRALTPTLDAPLLHVTRQALQWAGASDAWVDLARFQRALALTQQHAHASVQGCRHCCARLTEAVALYRGDFLEGLSVDSPAFDEWTLFKREWLRNTALDMLDTLVKHAELQRDYPLAYQHAWRRLEIDPLLEAAHQQVMRALALAGRRGEALAQYEMLSRLLRDELGVEPTTATVHLYDAIRQQALGTPQPSAQPLRAPGLRTALATHNLPRQHTRFVGRVEELQGIADRLADPNCHLLTLTGPGGVGKTRLAVQTGFEKTQAFADGVCFVSLAAVESAATLLPAVAAALQLPLGRTGGDEQALRQQLLYLLRARELLLILDNYEHLLPDVGLVIDLLASAPRLKLLVTSRTPLNLRAEWLLEVEGLPFPATSWAENPAQYPAMQLFQLAAERVSSTFAQAEQNSAIAEICRLAGGAPLAIELAAARVREVAVGEIAVQMAHDLDFVATTMPDVPERQRSTRASFEYTWRLLTADEQACLQRLAVFRGGFEPAAAAHVTELDPILLDSLAEKALIRRTLVDGPAATVRYDLHELIRQYAAEKLAAAQTVEGTTRTRHAAYFAKLLQERQEQLYGPTQQTVLVELRPDLDNIRHGWGWAITQRRPAIIQQSLEAFHYLYQLQGLIVEGEQQFERAAAMIGSLIDEQACLSSGERSDPEMQAQCLLLARLWAHQAEFCEALAVEDEKGKTLLERSLAVFRRYGARAEEAHALRVLAVYARKSGAFEVGKRLLGESLAAACASGDSRQQAKTLYELAFWAYLQDKVTDGEFAAHESLALCQARGDQRGIARGYSLLGLLAGTRGAFTEAHTYHQRNLKIVRQLADQPGIASTLNNLGLTAYKEGDYASADHFYAECQTLFDELGEPYGIALALYNRGRAAYLRGDYVAARRWQQQGLQIRQEMGRPYLAAISLLYLGCAWRALGELREAAYCYLATFSTALTADAPHIALKAVATLAAHWLQANNPETALLLLSFVQHHPQRDQVVFDDFVEEDVDALVEALCAGLTASAVDAMRQRAAGTDFAKINTLLQEAIPKEERTV